MAGSRQHFIPKFLQEGFTSHSKGDSAYVWVFRSNRAPYNTNVINSGVEAKFYTQNDDSSVDEAITVAEAEFATLIQNLRSFPDGVVSDSRIPELIAHLEVRTRNLRQGFLESGSYMVSRILDFIGSQDAFVAFIEKRIRDDPDLLRDSCRAQSAKLGFAPESFDHMMPYLETLLPQVLHQQLKPLLPKLAEQLRSSVPQMLREGAKSGHLKALKESLFPERKVEIYRGLTYRVCDFPTPDLILGDCAVLFKTTCGHYRPFAENDGKLSAIFLPLSPNRALIAQVEQSTTVDFHAMRLQSARCSLEYFVSHTDSEANKVLAHEIGLDAHPLTKDQIEEILVGILKGKEAGL